MKVSGGDKTWIVYQGPPRWDGSKWYDGDRFFLSGHGLYQCDQGVELARGITGLERPGSDYRYSTSANVPGSTFIDRVYARRDLGCSINILGDSPEELRRNKRRWMNNHPEQGEGRLWFFSADGDPRYLPVQPLAEAGTSTLDVDPAIRSLYEGFEWGWTSDSAFFLGYKHKQELTKKSTNKYSKTFYNPSTAAEVYPVLYLYGAGTWTLAVGESKIKTPKLDNGDVVRIDFNPRNSTYLLRKPDGSLKNLWPTLVGKRPDFFLEPQTKNTFEVSYSGSSPDKNPVLEYTPAFLSWN